MLAAGADVITLGNHTWRRGEIVPYLKESDRVIRPANLSQRAPGKGLTFVTAADGTEVAVINLLGCALPRTARQSRSRSSTSSSRRRASATPVIVVDFHAEATSEKVAMARWLDGKVTAVLGTHTHVQTNDARVLPGGTAAITDAGMTGPARLGDRRRRPSSRSARCAPACRCASRPAAGDVRIEGVLVECGADGRATAAKPVRVPGRR